MNDACTEHQLGLLREALRFPTNVSELLEPIVNEANLLTIRRVDDAMSKSAPSRAIARLLSRCSDETLLRTLTAPSTIRRVVSGRDLNAGAALGHLLHSLEAEAELAASDRVALACS